ncbi:hypothetical protein ACIP39_11840 [Streptomyces tibetensis]|uniref:hypothetical protein n=1 Tax=Streptomyces tibetensis TaxID=2382123 RepID=UPI003827EA41
MPRKNAETSASNPNSDGATSVGLAVSARFGMPQALVLLGFVAAAVMLRLAAGMSMNDSVTLLAAAGAPAITADKPRRV